ncbi:hypothetical protein ABMA27_002997 [Loxostege sticticalis]|uniref:Uncharacterized protein n=1 Tax=Loxostege sticticalis TaxID=481309 RepID=A0ABR3HRU2_LOXSC
MAKTKTKKTREEKLAQARLHKRKKYEEIKNDPEKYAIQKEKERQRYLKRKEQNKIKSVAKMTPREKRLQRKKWNENSRRYLEKKKKERVIQQMLIDNSPPTSDREENVDADQDPLEGPSHQSVELSNINCKRCQKKDKLIRRLRYSYKKEIGKLKQEKEKVIKEKEAMRKMLMRQINKQRKIQAKPSTGEKVDNLIKSIDEDKREEVKKKILFGEIIQNNLRDGFKVLRKKEKREFSDIVMRDKDRFKKHKVLGKTSKFTVRDKNKICHRNESNMDTESKIKQDVEEFFEDDCNTKISPDKKEFITRNGQRKQKRYLLDTLTNLHKKFMHVQNSNIGYSTFCKYRPFWVLYPKESDRNTCACKIHVNFDLLVKSLNKKRITKEANGTAILESLCCDIHNEECLNRTCAVCRNRVINYEEFNNEEQINYYQWCAKKETYNVKGQDKTKIVTVKTRLQDYPRNVIKKLEDSLKSYFKHCTNIIVQYKSIKSLKATMTTKEVMLHIDFSENYSVKFNEEIQSYHFGGSRLQITLHTAVAYLIDPETGIMKSYSVCSISECNRHDASAIWAHLIPLLGYVREISPLIDTVHFVSDSPSSQYRNRYIFFVISQLQQDFPELNFITWNYLEAGHGKGAPDGVGAVLKRTADQIIRFGNDIGTMKDFWELIQVKVKNVKLLSVSEQDIEDRKFPSSVQGFRGTMSVHQVLWSFDRPRITFRKLSCFLCENGDICSHNYHLGFMNLPCLYEDVDPEHLQDFLNENTTNEVLREVTNPRTPSPTNQFMNRSAAEASQNMKNSSNRAQNNNKITILSDVKIKKKNKIIPMILQKVTVQEKYSKRIEKRRKSFFTIQMIVAVEEK